MAPTVTEGAIFACCKIVARDVSWMDVTHQHIFMTLN